MPNQHFAPKGHDRHALMESEEYECPEAQLKLLAALAEGEFSVKSDADWLSIRQAFDGVEEQSRT